MGQVNIPYLVDGSVNVIGGMTTVYSSASYSTIAGWNISYYLLFSYGWVSNLCHRNLLNNGTADAGKALMNKNIFCGGSVPGKPVFPKWY